MLASNTARAVLVLQTIIIAQMVSIGGKGVVTFITAYISWQRIILQQGAQLLIQSSTPQLMCFVIREMIIASIYVVQKRRFN